MAVKSLRTLLENPGRLVMPGAYNAFLARQIAQAGFPGVYISGAGLSNSLGVPDNGACTKPEECNSGICTDGKCAPKDETTTPAGADNTITFTFNDAGNMITLT